MTHFGYIYTSTAKGRRFWYRKHHVPVTDDYDAYTLLYKQMPILEDKTNVFQCFFLSVSIDFQGIYPLQQG